MFREFVKDCELLDLGYVGHSYIWWNRPDGEQVIKARKVVRRRFGRYGAKNFKVLDDLQDKIKEMYESSDGDRETLVSLERELDTVWGEEEQYWQVRSKEKYLKQGDKNTKYFMLRLCYEGGETYCWD
ncbi:hypothetical protein LIER_06103 [Lithospermum erythrorhizon]|uniref:Uncharacterized protein n=1 Tax=Lithospermum erythrorhizon TaxID=34254 RepID=A0AAV3P4A9_LITER